MSEEYATTRQDFLTATASHLGLDVESLSPNSEVGADDAGRMVAVLHVWLKPSDIIGIGKRMQEIAKEQGDIVEIHTEPVMGENDTTAAMRKEYNALTQAEKGKHGSFGKYVTWRMMNDKPVPEASWGPERQVTHVDAPEEPEPTNMDAVWLEARDCTQAQMMHAVDADLRSGRHLVQWAMLTDEQKQKVQEAKP